MNLPKIPWSEFEFTYVRSRGPGGQNVNKTNSAVILRWNISKSSVFSNEIKERILTKLQHRLTEDGDIIIRSDIHRDQDQNRSECLERLTDLLLKALFVPKKRIKTKPTKSSQQRRVDSKKRKAIDKVLRRKVHDHG